MFEIIYKKIFTTLQTFHKFETQIIPKFSISSTVERKREKCSTIFGRIVQFCTMRFFFYRVKRGAISGETVGKNRMARRREESSSLLSRGTDKADCSGESKWYGWQESFQSGFSFISNAYQSGPSNAMHTLTQIPRRMFLQPREFPRRRGDEESSIP